MAKVALVMIIIILIIVSLVVIVSWVADYRFNQKVVKEVGEFYQGVENPRQVIKEKDLQGLPQPVQKWLTNAGVIGKEKIVAARTKQRVELRLKPEQSWMPAEVEQYFRTVEPGFIWKAKIKAAPLFHIAGRDKYEGGHGNMLIKLLSLITAADGQGPEIDQGTLLRYLAETMWFPTAALSDYIEWEEINELTAKATMTYEGVTVSGFFTFNEKGEMAQFEAERYGEFDGEYRLETWTALVSDYKDFHGFVIPSKGEIIWKLDRGDFDWYRFQVMEMDYNQPVVY